jgi:hypothetical protein
LSDFVAAGFSLRFSSSGEYMKISRNLRNLKDAATSPNITFDTGGLKSLNLGFSWLAIPHFPLTLMMCGFTIILHRILKSTKNYTT